MFTSDFANHLIIDDPHLESAEERCFCVAINSAMIEAPAHGPHR